MNDKVNPETDSETIRQADMGPIRALIFAFACGLLAANLYYAQPLISLIGGDIGVPESTLGFIVTLTQIGYCLGLLFVVPLADRFENRRMVAIMVAGSAIAMAVAGMAAHAGLFFAAVIVAGVCSVGAQVLVPLAAALSPAEKQGRVIGTIMAGLLAGIMLARPLASALAEFFGWRAAFLVPAILLAALVAVLWFAVPERRSSAKTSLPDIVRSMREIVTEEPMLRRRAFYQACMFCSFNVFWTASPLLLLREFGFSHGDIALFALAGAGGALAAPIAGQLADRGLTRVASAAAMLTVAVSFALGWPAAAAGSTIALVILAVTLDAGTQTNQVLGQNVVYSLRPEARARINAIYMTLMFIGGAIGSAMAPWIYFHAGWEGCVIAGSLVALAGFAVFMTEPRQQPCLA